MKTIKKTKKAAGAGFSLMELMVAMFVLVVGLLGGMMMVIIGMSRNNTNRVDTTATNVAQTVLEQIAGAPANSNPTLTVTDSIPNNILNINTAPGGAGLKANGDVDFSADTATSLNNNKYQMDYTLKGNNGLQTTYDVRWNIQKLGTWGKLVTVSARQPFVASQTGISFITPVTLRTIVSM
jgi:prepilin-type N-terminal cleavage/methylation domain-containing protein